MVTSPTNAEEPEVQQVKFSDLAPDGWFKDKAGSSIWMTCYRMLRVPPTQLNIGQCIDLEHVRVLLLRGTVSYLDSSRATIQITSEGEWMFDATAVQQAVSPQGTYALFLAPHDIDGVAGVEPVTRDRIREAVGLIGTLYGRNAVYQHLFDNLIELKDDKNSAFSPVFENPNWFPPLDMSETSVSLLKRSDTEIKKLPERDKNRTYLALRWLQYALYEMDGVSSFIRYWVALETLAMPDTSNIMPMNELLAAAYNITPAQAKQKFMTGRLFDLRSKIVHDGRIVPIHAQLQRYMEALFADLLAATLGMPCEERAAAVISDPTCDLPSYLRIP